MSLKKVLKFTSLALASSLVFSCANNGGISAPQIPLPQINTNDYTPNTVEFGPQLPPGTLPTEMTMSGLTQKELKSNTIIAQFGKIKQLYVDIKLNNGQELKNYNAVKWSVTNSDIGRISTRGVFEPLRQGSTKIIASIGDVSASVQVSVSNALNIWTQIISPTNQNLNDVKVVNNNEAWAVGDGGVILHYMNGSWINETSIQPVTSEDLKSVDATQDGSVWAVGGSTILKYNGSNWEVFPYSGGGSLNDIDITDNSASDGWIVGSDAEGKGLVLRFNGSGWQPIESDISRELNSVSALGPNEVWVGGKSRAIASPALYKFDGNKWKKANFGSGKGILSNFARLKTWDGTYEINSIRMLNSTQGWIVGEYSPVLSSLRGKRGFMFHYDSINDSWVRGSYEKSNYDLEQVPLRDVGMMSGGQGWVLGTNTPPNAVFNKEIVDIPGSFLRSDGKSLSVDREYQANTVGKSFNGIDLLPNGNGIVVGESGFIMHHQFDISRESYTNNGGYSSYNNYGTPSYGNGGGYGGNTGGYGGYGGDTGSYGY